MSQPKPNFAPRRPTRAAPYAPEEARQVLNAASASGLTLCAFARQHGLEKRLLYGWRAKLCSSPAGPKPSPPSPAATPLAFVPLVATSSVPHTADGGGSSGIELTLGDVTVRLQRGFCVASLRRALAVVAGGVSC